MPKLFRSPLFWLAAFIIWFVVLWNLSSESADETHLPDFPFSDKVCHFGYYFGGGGLLSACLFCWRPENFRWSLLAIQVAVIIGLVGVIDEYHQTFSPGRSGNDPIDWSADISGAMCGFLVFKKFHRALGQQPLR